MDVRLDGRCALVTGGSRGIGFAIAKKFADSGADVAILARSRDKLDQAKAEIGRSAKTRIVAVECDAASRAGVERGYAEAAAALGKVDILVNNAGTSTRGKFLEVSDEKWQGDLDLKVFGAVRFARLAIPGMQSRKWGRIINIVNIGARAPAAASMPTSVSRAAGIAITKALANEFAPDNILVNALAVGWIKSDQWIGFHRQEAPDRSYEEFLRMRGKQVPLGRIGEAEEFANVACLLASDAGGYVTGVCINIDGGRSPVV